MAPDPVANEPVAVNPRSGGRRSIRLGLRGRLVGYFLLLSGVTVLVVSLVAYLRATDDLTSAIYERLDAVVENKTASLSRWLDEQTRSVVFVGALPGFGDDTRVFLDPAASDADRSAAEARLREVLATVVTQIADAQELMILDLDGTVRLSTVPALEGIVQKDAPYFTRGTSHTTVQNVYASELTGSPTITVASPLFDQNGGGQRVAVLAANLQRERLDRIILETTGLGETGQTYLVGGDSRFVHERMNTGADADGVHSAGIDDAVAGHNGRGLYADYRGVPVIGVYRWLPEREAAIVAEISQGEAFASARQLALVIGGAGLLSALLLAIGIALIAQRVTRPILDLAAVATRVRGGDLEATARVTSTDEVGTLEVAFNEMTAQLRENVETLERRVDERTAELTTALGEIRRQKQYFESLVEISPAAVVTMDRDERVLGWNPAATRLFGFTADEARGSGDRRPRARRGRAARRGPGADPRGRGDRPRDADRAPRAQGRRAGRRRDRHGAADRRRRADRLLRDLPRHHGAAGRARGGRGGDAGEVDLPRQHEPRDPDADERGDRDERAAARHRAVRRPARLHADHPRQRRVAAHDHQRHPRLLEDRGGADGPGGRHVRPPRVRRGGAGADGGQGDREGARAGR